jgi:hypothetical protein
LRGGPIPREDFVYIALETCGLYSQLLASVVLRPAALVAEARPAVRRAAASSAAPGERFAVAVNAAAVPVFVPSPARFSAHTGAPHI